MLSVENIASIVSLCPLLYDLHAFSGVSSLFVVSLVSVLSMLCAGQVLDRIHVLYALAAARM